MDLVVIGVNHHGASVDVRECLAVPAEEKRGLCARLVDELGADEAVVVSTCNRTEVYLRRRDPDRLAGEACRMLAERGAEGVGEEARASIFEIRDREAVRHLFEVVTSLDSLVVGEPHIIGQVRDDFDRAREAGTIGKVLGRLFNRALELAKATRRETGIGDNPVSVSSIALDMAARVFGEVAGRNVLVLGAGEMGRQTAILAGHRGASPIVVCSRSADHAAELADRVGGKIRTWERREEAMVEADIIISSTGAPHAIIGSEQLGRVMQARRRRPVFLIDIALPRDVEPSVDSIYNVYRYDLDDLTAVARENESLRQREVEAVRPMINEALASFERWVRELEVVPAIVSLREQAEEIRTGELEHHLRRMHSLDERDANIVEALTVAIVNKVLHAPTVRLKDAADAGTAARHIGSLSYLFDLDAGEVTPPRRKREDDDD